MRLVRAFREHAAGAPNAPALITDDRFITYAELDHWSDGAAHALQKRGVGPGVIVGTLLSRDIPLAVALLGIVKAGGGYLPVPFEYPDSRRREVLRLANAHLVIADRAHIAEAAALTPHFWCMPPADLMNDEFGGRRVSFEPETTTADAVAYVNFTSGTSGRPRGVVVPLRGIERLVLDCDFVPLGPDLVVGQAATVSFDAFTFEFWGPLTNGSTLRFLTNKLLSSIPALLTASAAGRPAAVFLTTSLFNRLARTTPRSLAAIDHVLFGGEVADIGGLRAFIDAANPRRLVHCYGPTETTTFATWWEVDRQVLERSETVPIGRPLQRTTIAIIGPDGRPCQPSEIGEIYIGGDGVALGYVAEPSLTETKFPPDPKRPGSRVYRTGDLGRSCGDVIEFVGRMDDQVKLNGFRVEPGEVEATALRHPGVDAAAVVVPIGWEPRALVAYVVLRSGVCSSEVDAFLAEHLPIFSVPSKTIALSELPLTATGKVDRRALAERELAENER